MKYILLALTGLLLVSCSNPNTKWEKLDSFDLGKTTPIGIVQLNEHLVISDGDNNKIVYIDQNGKTVKEVEEFDRPMHLDEDNGKLYVPEYGLDQITIIDNDKRSSLPIGDSLDAPAGIDVSSKKIAVADFYNHQVLFFNGEDWNKIGKKGKEKGAFHYPTDVQLKNDKIYVADAYNNRIQIFDEQGQFLQMIGERDSMNATTGIFVSENEIFATDFENNRVLIYDLDGKKKQVIDNLNKPTDLLVSNKLLIIANYGSKSLDRYNLK